jgi:hypothetical protein
MNTAGGRDSRGGIALPATPSTNNKIGSCKAAAEI